MTNASPRYIVGLMSGTSADGIDAALVELTDSGLQTDWHLVAFASYPYTEAIRDKVLRACSLETSNVQMICELNFELGSLFADATESVCRQASVPLDQIALVGSHGQTIYHQPSSTGIGTPSTLQIGEAAVIARRTGITTISDFRVADVAAGGEGAPLLPYIDFIMFRKPGIIRALQNIGGISNVTYLPDSIDGVRAFDTGPGNMLLDGAMRHFTGEPLDSQGAFAAQGEVHTGILSQLMTHPFLAQSPPKSTGREAFGEDYLRYILDLASKQLVDPEDTMATLTAFTVECIVTAYHDFLHPSPEEVLVSGGGVHNKTLMRYLGERLAPIPVHTMGDFGCPADAREAIAFALLANEFVAGHLSNLPQVTGAKHRALLGKLVPGLIGLKSLRHSAERYNDVDCRSKTELIENGIDV